MDLIKTCWYLTDSRLSVDLRQLGHHHLGHGRTGRGYAITKSQRWEGQSSQQAEQR